ncbi:hypothetical protein J437_LFUL017592 [Ladona fulva]|uniref:DRBM domain-containing protein n=1 Tax=Ladona fulva TaxID=123851 RepID=A0A8K0KWM2_LADFU|nr:hypothetical protein J437_LFUL017592 [Ladona fulva]
MDELVNLFHKFDVVPQSDSEDFQSKRIGREVAINTKTSSSGFIEDAASNPSKGILHNVAAQVKAKLNIDMELQTYGQGRSKKTAEHDAADHALQYLKSLNVLTEDGRLSIVCGGGKHGGERRRNHGRKRGDCEDGRKRKEDRRRKWDKDQETGNWGCRSKEEPKDVHRGSHSERGKCIYKEVDWWNKDGVAMDEEVDGDCEGERAVDEEVVEDWWDRAGEEATDGESKPGTKRLSLINSLGMEPSKRLCSRQDEEAAVGHHLNIAPKQHHLAQKELI